MDSLFDYLDWRGDIAFSYDGVNEVDCALLAWLTYFDYENLLAGDGRKDSLKNICDRYLKQSDPGPFVPGRQREGQPHFL